MTIFICLFFKMFWLRLWLMVHTSSWNGREFMIFCVVIFAFRLSFRRLASLLLSRQILSHFFVAILYPACCLFATIFCCMIRVFAEQLAVVSSSQWAPERTWGVVECDVLCEFDMQFDFCFFSLRLSSSRHFADRSTTRSSKHWVCEKICGYIFALKKLYGW